MKDIFKGQPLADKAPQGLRNKVEFAARQPQKASWFNGGFKWAATGTAVAAAVTAGVMFMTPATARSWDDVTDAYQDVRSALIQINFQEDGDSEEILIAVKGNRFRVSISGEMDISMNNGELMIYEAGSDEAMLMQFDGLPFQLPTDKLLEQMVSEFSMANILKEAEGDIGKDNIRISDVYLHNGRSVYDVQISDEGMNAFVRVDAKSDLPLDLEIEEVNDKGVMTTKAIMSFRFNGEVDDSLLEFAIPSGVKINPINMGDMMHGGDEDFDFGGMFGGDRHDEVEADQEDDREVIISTKVSLDHAVLRS